ncbi:MAG: hypothetical protein L6R45_08045 [Anaerolineae bacterium]|nr:hypothetical protein [Anaerolineae bacterium]
MSIYEENERALKELIQGIKSVPGTFPPVYNCGDMLIGYDRQGQFRVMASIKSEPVLPAETDWLKQWQARLTPLTHNSENEQNLIDYWIHRWQARRWKPNSSPRPLEQI